MKKRTGNNKVMRAIAVALATMIAVTSVPVTTYAEDPEEQPIVVENLIKEADHDNSNDENKNDPGPGVSQLIDTAQSSMETATDKKPSEGDIKSQDPATAAQGYLNAAAGNIDDVVTDLNNFKNANNTANQAASQYAQEIEEAVDNAAAVVFVPEVDDQNNPVYVQATDEDGNLLYEDEEKTIPKFVQAIDPETSEPMWADEAKTIPVYEQKMKAVPVGSFKTASETTENKSQSAIDNSDIANKSGNESVARKAQADANADLEDAKKGLTDANTAVTAFEKSVENAWTALKEKQAQLDEAEKVAKAAQKAALEGAVRDSAAANANVKLCQGKVAELNGEFDQTKLDLITAYIDLQKISEEKAKVEADESKSEEEKKEEIKKLNGKFNAPAATLTKLLIVYYMEQQCDDYKKETPIYVGIGEDGKYISIKEKLITSYEKDGSLTTVGEGNPWQKYKEVKTEVSFPDGVDGNYGYHISNGWIYSNEYKDNCVVVQYTGTDNQIHYKYFNFKPVDNYKRYNEVKESGSTGSLFFYEREFEVDHNGDIWTDQQNTVNDWFVNGDFTGTKFTDLYNEENGNLDQVITSEDGNTKIVPDLSNKSRQTDDKTPSSNSKVTYKKKGEIESPSYIWDEERQVVVEQYYDQYDKITKYSNEYNRTVTFNKDDYKDLDKKSDEFKRKVKDTILDGLKSILSDFIDIESLTQDEAEDLLETKTLSKGGYTFNFKYNNSWNNGKLEDVSLKLEKVTEVVDWPRNHYEYPAIVYTKVEKEVGHEKLRLDKGIKWLTDTQSIEKAIAKGTLKGTKDVEELKKKYDDLQQAIKDLEAAQKKAEDLEKNVKKLQEQMGEDYVAVDRSALEELSLKLELETERLEEARKKKAILEDKVREAQRAVDSIDLSRFIPVDDDDDDRPSSPGTSGGVFTLPSGIEVIPLAAAPASGVAGVRTGRRNSGTVASNNSGVLGVRTEGSDTTKKEDVEPDNQEEEKTDVVDKELKKVDNPTSPLAETPFEEGAGMNWLWLLAAAAAAGAGAYGYGKHRKAVAANDEAKKYKK